MYIYIYVAVSCKRYPPSLLYIIIVQTCGKRLDLLKFVDILSMNLGFSRLLIYLYYKCDATWMVYTPCRQINVTFYIRACKYEDIWLQL